MSGLRPWGWHQLDPYWAELIEDFVPPGPFRVVANPPYALTAAVLSFVARASHLTAADLILQRAAVRRVVDHRPRELRRLSANRGRHLPRAAFTPRPPVDSGRSPTPRAPQALSPDMAAEEASNIPRNQASDPRTDAATQDRRTRKGGSAVR